jgi:ParB-like chromosome segregation protein Spo0J
MNITYLYAEGIIPLHGVHDPEKLKKLTASMEDCGWQDRPILCLDFGDRVQALTGSHRIAAAVAAGIDKIPAYVVDVTDHICNDDGECILCGSECWVAMVMDGIDDDDRLAALRESGDAEAIRLLEQEIRC